MYKIRNIQLIRKQFSIIEMMTVVVIILLLMSLVMPVFVNVKMNARTTICRNQLKQIGSLLTSYTTEYGGFLPNNDGGGGDGGGVPFFNDMGRRFADLPLYHDWQGHLIPFLDLNLPYKYDLGASAKVVGGQVVVGPAPVAGDVFKNGWIVLNDAFQKGGYDQLKVFICPEIHANTTDLVALKNGWTIPRVGHMMYKWNCYGVPSTYLANSNLFGFSGRGEYRDNPATVTNSLRMDQIENISQKALIIEGGQAFPDDFCLSTYYTMNNYYVSNSGGLIPNFDYGVNDEGNQKLSFVHDPTREFWTKGGKLISRWASISIGGYNDLANKFNTQFAGKAMMIAGSGDSSGWAMSYTLVSFVDPDNGKIFKDFFTANSTLSSLNGWTQFVGGTEIDSHFLVGKMNVLFGDGSVDLKDNAWLCNNRMKTAMTAY